MKSSEDILRYVLEHFTHYLSRPASYASTPEALEQILIDLDRLRLYLVTDVSPQSLIRFRGQYYDFLASEQHDVALFTTRHKSGNVQRDFAELCAFWKRYLRSSDPPVLLKDTE